MKNPKESSIIAAAVVGKYCVIRGRDFGVFAGTVEAVDDACVLLKNARRLWYWDGAASISQIAAEGVKNPGDCKFTVAVESIVLRDYIEAIPCADQAATIIQGVKEWKR